MTSRDKGATIASTASTPISTARTVHASRWILAALAFLVWLVAPPAQGANPAPGGGHIALSVPGAQGVRPGPLVLASSGPAYSGEFMLRNVGSGPLRVLRVAILDDADDVRSPPGLSARLAGASALPVTIDPGDSRGVLVSWEPGDTARVRQAFAQVVVTSTDEERGEVAMGVLARLPTGLGWVGEHALSLLVLLPLLTLAVAVASRAVGSTGGGLLRAISLVVAGVEWFLALWVYRAFVPGVGRQDGNDGFQLVERSVVSRAAGVEWYAGVDRTSILLVVLVATLAFLSETGTETRTPRGHAALALLTSGVMATLVALDLGFFFVAWQTIPIALALLVGAQRGPGHEVDSKLTIWGYGTAARFGVPGAIGASAMLGAFVALWRASGRSFLVDGGAAAHTMSIPELARTSFAGHGSILGLPSIDVIWGLLLVAMAASSPVMLGNDWLPDVLEEAPAAAAALLGGVAMVLGPYLLTRLGLDAVPEGPRWAAPAAAILGAVGMVRAAVRAIDQRETRRVIAYATVALAGSCLCAVGASRWFHPG
jgi:NADH-quinone oxidoreductase subunit M